MDEARSQTDLNALLARRLPSVALATGGVFTILTSAHLLLNPGKIIPLLAAASALTALCTAGSYFYFTRRAVQPDKAHPIAALIAGLVLLNFLLQLYLTGSPAQSGNLLLLMVALGFILLSTNWLILFLILIPLGWSLVVRTLPPGPDWTTYSLGMAIAAALSLAIHLAYMKVSRQLVRLRREEARNKAELETVLKTTETAQRSLAATMAVGQRITSILDLDDLLNQVVELIRVRFGYSAVGIYLLDEDQQNILLQAVSDKSGRADAHLGLTHKINGPGLPAWVAAHARPARVEDISLDPRCQEVAYLPNTHSELAIPLEMGRELLGVLDLRSDRLAAFREDDVALIQTLADQVAIAIRNAQLYDQVRRFNLDLEELVSRRTEELQSAYDKLHKLDRAKSDFIDIASHELRTPLTVIQGYCQMLSEEPPILSNEQYMRLTDGILSGTRRLNEIIESMLDVAKIDNRVLDLYPTPVPIASLVHFVIESLRPALKERQINLTIDLQALPPIEADVDALRKVFYHLIVNAIKFTPDGGSIQVNGRVLHPREYNLPGNYIEVEVSDTGIGIDPNIQELIFTKFYQTGQVAVHSSGKTKFKGGGPGLGLAIARGIIELHGGRIWVVSEGYDETTCPGSHFHVVLPIKQN